MKNKALDTFYNRIRGEIAIRKAINSSSFLLLIWLFTAFLMVNIESIFYLEPSTKSRFIIFILGLAFFSIVFIITQFVLSKFSFFNNSSHDRIAIMVWDRFPDINDRLYNVTSLEKTARDKNSQDLIDHASLQVSKQISEITASDLYSTKNVLLYLSLSVLLLLFAMVFNPYNEASSRLVNYSKVYEPYMPFELKSLSNDISVVSGDSINIRFSSTGDAIPSAIELHIIDDKKNRAIKKIDGENNIFESTISNVSTSSLYWAQYNNRSLFSSWDTISSDSSQINIINRPIIKDLVFNVFPPLYTGKDPYTHQPHVSDISAPEGSTIEIIISQETYIDNIWVDLGTHKKYFTKSSDRYYMEFDITENKSIEIGCVHSNGLENSPKPNYRIDVVPDYQPDIRILSPKSEIEIDDMNEIIISYQARDDYMIAEMRLEYYTLSPDYMLTDTTYYIETISIDKKPVVTGEHVFSLDNIFLAPDDEIHLRLLVSDNNPSNPSTVSSNVIIARLPSLEELYSRMDDGNENVMDDLSGIEESIDDIEKLMEDVKLDLLKENDLSWEQEEELKNTVEEIQAIASQMEEIQDAMSKLQEQAEKNNLLDDQMIQKYDKFQDLLEEIMTPELIEAMEKLQEAMEKMDYDEMLRAVENFEYDLEMFEEQIDRLIDMFEIAIAEQKLDELSKSIESIAESQKEIIDALDSENMDFEKLASNQRYQEERFKNFESLLEDTISSIENISSDTASELQMIAGDSIMDETKTNLTRARESMQEKNLSESQDSAEQSADSLESLSSMIDDAQDQFNDSMMEDIRNEFLSIIHGMLYISANQEKLIVNSNGVHSRNPIIPSLARQQNVIMIENNFINKKIMDLSKKTFHITPDIARAMGKTYNSISKSISFLEQKQIIQSRKEQEIVIDNLNLTTNLLIESLEQMQESGSASGFQSFMEQLEEMSKQQEGINKGTIQMGQMGMASQMNMMEQLMQQQEALKKQLEEMLSENPGEGEGGLGRAKDDMDEVVDDFRRGNVTRETIDRQQQILSRLIDSQRSLNTRDYSNKRKSETGNEFQYIGPSGLPVDMGERDKELSNAMRSALDENLPIEYNKLINNYFKGLYNGD